MRRIIFLFVILLLAASCTTQKPLYNWAGYDQAVYNYTKNSDEKSLNDLISIYEKIIQKTGARNVPPPGVYADLGYLLTKKGEVEKGKEMLKMEIALYPESERFIGSVLKRIEK